MTEEYPIWIDKAIFDAVLNAPGWIEVVPESNLAPGLQRVLAYVRTHADATTHEAAAYLGLTNEAAGAQLQRLLRLGYVTSWRENGRAGRVARWRAGDANV